MVSHSGRGVSTVQGWSRINHTNTNIECSMLRISGKVVHRIKVTFSGKGLENFIPSRQCPFLLILTCHNGGIAGDALSFWRFAKQIVCSFNFWHSRRPGGKSDLITDVSSSSSSSLLSLFLLLLIINCIHASFIYNHFLVNCFKYFCM